MSLCAPGNCDEHFLFNTLPDYVTYPLYHRAATTGQLIVKKIAHLGRQKGSLTLIRNNVTTSVKIKSNGLI